MYWQFSSMSSASCASPAARAAVEGRVKEEGTAAPAADTPTVDHEFVKRCLYAGQKGDGLMYAALNRGKLLNIPTQKASGFWRK